MVHFACYANPCAQNQNGTCHLEHIMALFKALTANYVTRYMPTKWVKALSKAKQQENRTQGVHSNIASRLCYKAEPGTQVIIKSRT